MKALSGYAEWFWLMAQNIKPVENRPWPLPRYFSAELPVRIYLHASKTKTPIDEYSFITRNLTTAQYEDFRIVEWDKLRGHIIGEITITGQFHKGDHEKIFGGHDPSVGDQQRELEILHKTLPEYFSSWSFGPFCFVVKDGVLYDEPVPCKGKLGFFEPEFAGGL